MKLRFRIWEVPTKRFFYQEELDIIFKNPSVIPTKIFSGEDDLLKIQQSSGILDKNGAEIFQGDIIRGYTSNDGEEVIAEVLFSPYRGFYINHTAEMYDRILYDGGIPIGPSVEVIGNIFQNKYLIKQ